MEDKGPVGQTPETIVGENTTSIIFFAKNSYSAAFSILADVDPAVSVMAFFGLFV